MMIGGDVLWLDHFRWRFILIN